MKDDRGYLLHILNEIRFLKRIFEGRTLQDLISDDYFGHAVRSAIEVNGDVSKNSSHSSSVQPSGP